MAQDIQFAWGLYHGYENYMDKHLSNRRFKYSNILPLIHQLKNKNIFTVKKVGESAEGRDLYLISIGKGDKKIFCWSQMHGDEPTATAALFDIFNFFLAENHYNDFKRYLFERTTLYFMPMVNPDGAELFQRRNISEIDLNRDAAKKQSREAKILYSAFEEIKPGFGFNLHDQDRAYAAGLSGKSAAINEREGFVKIIFDEKYGELLGAHIIGSEATEMIAEIGIAKSMEADYESIVRTIHAHPTLSESIMEAAANAYGESIHI